MSRETPAGLKHAGFQRIVTNSTATGLNTTCALAQALWLSVETQSIRVRFDSTVPTANTGILFTAANSPYFMESVNGSILKISRAAAGAIVNVEALKR